MAADDLAREEAKASAANGISSPWPGSKDQINID